MAEEKLCFVIAPIGDADSDTRKRSDQVLKHVIRPAVTTCGYKAVRADEIDKPGLITSQVIQHVVNDPLVVADLTERNPNVFYELAIRHALRRPLVQLIRKGETIPFDVAGTRTIYVDHHDLDSVEAAKNEIVEQVRSLERDDSDLETPISVSLDLQLLRQSDKPEERSLADLVANVVELRTSLSKLEAKIGTQEQQGVLDEIQSELRSLPARLDEYADSPRMPWMRRGRVHPMMLRELMHAGPHSSPAMGILVIASIFRDWMPWLHELGLELYRLARRGKSAELDEAASEFRRAVEFAVHGPMSREFMGRRKDMYMLIEEIDPLLDRALSMLDEGRASRRRLKKDAESGPSGDEDV
jgi:exonuclease VII small subunit